MPGLAGFREAIAGRAMLVTRAEPVAFECVVRGYLSGSAWGIRRSGTLAGERLPVGLTESARFPAPVFSPATKASTGHDENVPEAAMTAALGPARMADLKARSLALFAAGSAHAEAHGIIIADTKFEFGIDREGRNVLIDGFRIPPDSGPRRSTRRAGRSELRQTTPPRLPGQPPCEGAWNGDAPPPPLPAEVVAATSARYLEAFRLLTGHTLPEQA